MSGLLKNLLTVLGVIAVGGAGYYIFNSQQVGNLDIRGVDGVDPQIIANTQLFIERRAVLDSLSLSTSLFDDPKFSNLRSFATPVPELPVGRENPFLPAEDATASTPESPVSTQ